MKSESVEVLSVKAINLKQGSTTANIYCYEVEDLTKSLENTYISDGLSSELASKYSLQIAVKGLTKNCSIDKVKLIMEADEFNSMDEFVNSKQQNAILYSGQKNKR